MATTAKPIDFLVTGMRDTTGAVVASGKVRWYLPGTLTPAVAYSDAACTTPITAPLTLNAGGQGSIYCLEPVRVIVKDTTESTTYYDDIAPLQRHDSVYVTATGINSGAETTLENVLATAVTSFGAGFQYKESTGATARNYVDWMGELVVSVKDFGALGDGTTDDTVAIQAASDRVKARGGGWVYWPKGTYKITAAITGDTVGVSHCGAGRAIAVIKNFSTSASAFSINVGSSIDSKIVIRDLSITANTTSSGSAITVPNGNRIKIDNVAVALHRTGIGASTVTDAFVLGCYVESTDDNASAIGITVGSRGRVDNCNVISGTTNGTGLSMGATTRAIDCYIEKFATGVSLAGAGAVARNCVSATATTAFSLGAAGVITDGCAASGATTGYTVGAFANCGVPFCAASTCTTDLTVNAAATLFNNIGTTFVGTITNSALTPVTLPLRSYYSLTSTASLSPSFTPDISGGKNVNQLYFSATGGQVNCTFNAHSTATLAVGDWLIMVFHKSSSTPALITFPNQYQDLLGATVFTTTASILTVDAGKVHTVAFVWNGTKFVLMWSTGNVVM